MTLLPPTVEPPACPSCLWQPPAAALDAHRWHRLGRHLGAEHPFELVPFLAGIDAGRAEALAELDAVIAELDARLT